MTEEIQYDKTRKPPMPLRRIIVFGLISIGVLCLILAIILFLILGQAGMALVALLIGQVNTIIGGFVGFIKSDSDSSDVKEMNGG